MRVGCHPQSGPSKQSPMMIDNPHVSTVSHAIKNFLSFTFTTLRRRHHRHRLEPSRNSRRSIYGAENCQIPSHRPLLWRLRQSSSSWHQSRSRPPLRHPPPQPEECLATTKSNLQGHKPTISSWKRRVVLITPRPMYPLHCQIAIHSPDSTNTVSQLSPHLGSERAPSSLEAICAYRARARC